MTTACIKAANGWFAREPARASIGRFVADLVKDPQRYANQNLGISQPNTDGNRPAAYL